MMVFWFDNISDKHPYIMQISFATYHYVGVFWFSCFAMLKLFFITIQNDKLLFYIRSAEWSFSRFGRYMWSQF